MSLREQHEDRPPALSTARERIERDRRKAARRRSVGIINRRLGWIITPIVLSAMAVHWGPDGFYGWRNTYVVIAQLIFAPLTFVHAAMSVYVFGLVPIRRTLRVFHIWFGYAYLIFMFAAQTTFAWETLHDYLTVAMVTSLLIHILIGLHFVRRRRAADASRVRVPDTA